MSKWQESPPLSRRELRERERRAAGQQGTTTGEDAASAYEAEHGERMSEQMSERMQTAPARDEPVNPFTFDPPAAAILRPTPARQESPDASTPSDFVVPEHTMTRRQLRELREAQAAAAKRGAKGASVPGDDGAAATRDAASREAARSEPEARGHESREPESREPEAREPEAETQLMPAAQDDAAETQLMPTVGATPAQTELMPAADDTSAETRLMPAVDDTAAETKLMPAADDTAAETKLMPAADDTSAETKLMPAASPGSATARPSAAPAVEPAAGDDNVDAPTMRMAAFPEKTLPYAPPPARERESSSAPAFDDIIAPLPDESEYGVTGNTLILSSIPAAGPAMGPVGKTGEMLATGSIELPHSLSTTGQHARFDSSELDRMFESDEQRSESASSQTSGIEPVRARSAVSTHTSTRDMVAPAKNKENRLPIVLAASAGVMAVGVLGMFVAGAIWGVF